MARAYWSSTAKDAWVAAGRRGHVRSQVGRDGDWERLVQVRDGCFFCGVRADLGCKHQPGTLANSCDGGESDLRSRALAQALLAARRAGGAR